MFAPRTGIVWAAVALATLGRAGALQKGGPNTTGGEDYDPCRCLNWRSVYHARIPAPCGMSNEYFFASGIHEPAPEHVVGLSSLWSHFCTDFFMRIDDRVCVNVNIGSEYGQWCFVDAACGNLNGAEGKGGITGNKRLKWKQCASENGDVMLRDYTVDDLIAFADRNHIPFHVADHYAWPTFYHGQWKDVQEFFMPGFKTSEKIHWELREELESIVAYGKPVVFDQTATFGPPHMVVEGHSRFNVADERTTAAVSA